jgi:dTDP-4-dehydrorhamnose 3,5-epimerase
MIFIETKLKGAFIIDIERREDSRGFFARAFCQREFTDHGLKPLIAQANIAFNRRKGTLRGMHFQYPPAAETKLVKATRGAILDIIVDLRPESPTYLEHVAVELTENDHRALYVPERFAHGYQVLEDQTETSYQVGEFYVPEAEGGLHYRDPRLGLKWPLPVEEISPKDAAWRLLGEVEPELKRRMTVGSAVNTERDGRPLTGSLAGGMAGRVS